MRNDRTPGPRKFSNRPGSSGSKGSHGPHGKPPYTRPTGEAPRLDRDRAIKEMERYTSIVLKEMGLDLSCTVALDEAEGNGGGGTEQAERGMVVRFEGADEALLLERNAELLLDLEYIAHRWLRLDPRLHDQVRFDCGDYRTMRLDELKLSARVAAQRVRETGQDFHFNPMSSRDRRIIHLELTGAQGVRTASEGMGDRRHIVIYPANKK
jgi:spoIIIJ-associated protein